MAGTMGGCATASNGRGLAVVTVMTAERTFVGFSILGARKWHAIVLEFVHSLGRIAAQVFNRVLVAEPVRSFDRVVHVPAPVIGPLVGKRCRDTSFGSDGMRSSWKYFRDACRFQASFDAAERSPQAGAPGTDNHNVIRVVDQRVSKANGVRGKNGAGSGRCWHCKKIFD